MIATCKVCGEMIKAPESLEIATGPETAAAITKQNYGTLAAYAFQHHVTRHMTENDTSGPLINAYMLAAGQTIAMKHCCWSDHAVSACQADAAGLLADEYRKISDEVMASMQHFLHLPAGS